VTWQVGKIPYFGSFGRYTTSSTTTRQRSICGPPLISLIAGRRMFPYLSVCAMRRQGSERNYVVTSRNGHYSRHIAPISKRYHSRSRLYQCPSKFKARQDLVFERCLYLSVHLDQTNAGRCPCSSALNNQRLLA
jgi:hypothetical protein